MNEVKMRKKFKAAPRSILVMGTVGAIMVLGASIWSMLRTPAPAPGAEPDFDRTPASQQQQPTPPGEARQEQQPSQALHQGQQQQQQAESKLGMAFSRVASEPSQRRVAWWSRWLAEDPHAHAALRELGSEPPARDTAPLVPPRFNCTTFVETVTALARSSEPSAFTSKLLQIRYRGDKPSYLSRNHFPEADWIPNNIEAGVLSDLTETVASRAGVELQVAQKTLDRPGWLSEQKRRYSLVSRALAEENADLKDSKWQQVEKVSLKYIPSSRIEAVAAAIPDGAIINFVRRDERRRPALISHQGFVIREGNGTLLRHSSPAGTIRTVDLRSYFKKHSGIVGFVLEKVEGSG